MDALEAPQLAHREREAALLPGDSLHVEAETAVEAHTTVEVDKDRSLVYLYSCMISKYPLLVLLATSSLSIGLAAIAILTRGVPSFDKPDLGFVARGTSTAGRMLAAEVGIELAQCQGILSALPYQRTFHRFADFPGPIDGPACQPEPKHRRLASAPSPQSSPVPSPGAEPPLPSPLPPSPEAPRRRSAPPRTRGAACAA